MIRRGGIHWAEFEAPRGSSPGYRHPVVVVQAGAFNRSRLRTVVVAVLTSNLGRAAAPGNVRVASHDSGLPRDSVVNVSQLLTLDLGVLSDEVGFLPGHLVEEIDAGLRLVLGL
ncbi:MAG: type II toxin-antitoxin system PemK/MazF family toxin [Candidatus Krumholzibacteriia bacterium]